MCVQKRRCRPLRGAGRRGGKAGGGCALGARGSLWRRSRKPAVMGSPRVSGWGGRGARCGSWWGEGAPIGSPFGEGTPRRCSGGDGVPPLASPSIFCSDRRPTRVQSKTAWGINRFPFSIFFFLNPSNFGHVFDSFYLLSHHSSSCTGAAPVIPISPARLSNHRLKINPVKEVFVPLLSFFLFLYHQLLFLLCVCFRTRDGCFIDAMPSRCEGWLHEFSRPTAAFRGEELDVETR